MTKPRISVRTIIAVAAVLVLGVMLLDATWRSDDEPLAAANGRAAFDAEKFGKDNFAPKVVPELEKRAVELTELVPALEKDADAAGEQYGVRQGQSPYNFAVRGEGVAKKVDGSIVELEVDGVPSDVTVSLQIGPAINGSALRDASGLFSFNDFLNQVEYAGAGTALNNEVKATVLKDLDRDSLEGKTVKFLGAFTFLAPTAITVTPAQLEVGA
jgi:predicted lipoprotein